MPRYFFDIVNAGERTQDEIGDECENDEDARNQAVSLLPHIAQDELPDGDQHEFAVTVRNEFGQAVYEASLVLHGRWWSERG